jgi:hypothetical protein
MLLISFLSFSFTVKHLDEIILLKDFLHGRMYYPPVYTFMYIVHILS